MQNTCQQGETLLSKVNVYFYREKQSFHSSSISGSAPPRSMNIIKPIAMEKTFETLVMTIDEPLCSMNK